jgi:hydroxylamine reductase
MPPRRRYRGRLYTTHGVGYEGIQHIDVHKKDDLQKVIDHALELPGFDAEECEKWKESKPHLTGFGHQAVLSNADVIIKAIQSGNLEHIFIIGGCDGTEKSRSYFSELARHTPDKSLILTMGCGKYRLRNLELGNLGDTQIPRILDLGQCNDSYSAVVIATKLAQALNTDIHHLPLHFAVSWFEQKAVAVFLSLLHLGVRNIRLGPALPAFLTPNVRKYLLENCGVKQVNMEDEAEDLDIMLKETVNV